MSRDMQETQDVYRKGQTHFTTVNVVLKKKRKVGEKEKKMENLQGRKIKAWVCNILITPHDLEENHQSEFISGAEEERTKEFQKRLCIF